MLSLVIVSSRAIVPVAVPVLSAVHYKLDADRHRRASLDGLAPTSPLVRPAPIPFCAPKITGESGARPAGDGYTAKLGGFCFRRKRGAVSRWARLPRRVEGGRRV